MHEAFSLSKRFKARALGVHLPNCYGKAKVVPGADITLMNEIQDIYTKRPFQGYRRMTWDLKDLGYAINHKRVYRLMKAMGLQAIYPKKNLSKRNQVHKVYPYLLKEHPPQKPHDAYYVDITYLKMAVGFVYLIALIDGISGYIVGHYVSTTLDTESCLRALENAINAGNCPKIMNTDQGCQFTAQEWLYALSLLQIRVSMVGKGRCLDNIPIERFWRTIKYEEVYLKTYETVIDARDAITDYINWYNHSRRHSALGYKRPYEVMQGLICISQKKRADGYVDNTKVLPHISTASTATAKCLNLENINHNKILSSHSQINCS
jgi:putative transposase